MIATATQAQIHADYMAMTAHSYDLAVCKGSYIQNLNSLSPAWIVESALSGGIWGPLTEHTEHARAVAEAYRVKPRFSNRKYPALGPQNDDGDEVFFQVTSYETRSLVFKTIERQERYDGHTFTNPRERNHHEVEAKISAPEGETPEVLPIYRYELVTEEDLNCIYAAYLMGEETDATVMEAIINFVQRKLELGNKEFTLRGQGADDIIGSFWEKMSAAVTAKRFKGKNGSQFSHYVNSAWGNRRNSSYRSLKKYNDVFESSTPQPKYSTDADGNSTDNSVSVEDQFALAQHDVLKTDQTRESANRVHELMASLKGIDLIIAQEMLAGFSQSLTAERVNLSRHQVRRVEKKLRKLLVRAGQPMKTGRAA
jgi:hypothetical protein